MVEEPITLAERKKLAGACTTGLKLSSLPTLVDKLDDAVNRAYLAHPDRLYLVDRQGKIAYAGGPGPWGFRPDELERAIVAELKKQKAEIPKDDAPRKP